MTDHFNGLTPKDAELLAMLSEEAAEIIQIKEKIMRHGFDSHHPAKRYGPNNRIELSREIGDLLGVYDRLVMLGIIDPHEVDIYRASKMDRAKPYLHHQDDPG